MTDREAPGMPGETEPLTRGEAIVALAMLALCTVILAVAIGLLVKVVAYHWPLS